MTGPQPPSPAPEPSRWPSTLAGYAKTLLAALGALGVGGVMELLRDNGVTTMPGWANWLIVGVVTIAVVLFGPKNKP